MNMDRYNYGKSGPHAFSKSPEIRLCKNLVCHNCSQLFSLRDFLHVRGPRCPLVLQCGHSACESCIRTSVQNNKKVICGLCKHVSTPTHQSADIRADFPLNRYLLGVFTVRRLEQEPEDSKVAFAPVRSVGFGRKSHLQLSKENQKEDKEICIECEQDAEWKCVQCEVLYCTPCFAKVHKAGKAFGKHKKSPIERGGEIEDRPTCATHSGEALDLYCTDCSQMVCPRCVFLTHRTHDVKQVAEQNEEDMEKLDVEIEKATEVLKRLVQSQKKLKSLDCPKTILNTEQVEREIAQHFLFIHGALQLLEERVLEKLKQAKTEAESSVDNITHRLQENLDFVTQLLQEAVAAKQPVNIGKVFFSEIIKKLEELENMPCHLMSTNVDKPSAKFTLDDSFMEKIATHCDLTLENTSSFSLVSLAELPADAEVEPIELEVERDVMVTVNSRASSVAALSDTPDSDRATPTLLDTVDNKSSWTTVNIAKGSADVVVVVHIRDPSSFYVHRVSDLPTIESLSIQLNKHARMMTKPPEKIELSGLYIVPFSVDKKWYRVRVVQVHPPTGDEIYSKADLLYIDYGNVEKNIPVSRLRNLPARFAEQVPLALHCSLFGIKPKNGKWTNEATFCLARMVNGHRVKMVVMDYSPDTYQVDLGQVGPGESPTNDVPVSVRDALVFLEHACFFEEDKFKITPKEKSAQYFQENDFKKGLILNVLISHLVTPHSFYVQRLGDHAKYLTTVMHDMNKAYTAEPEKGLIFKPQIGMPCAAKFSVDQRWYRARVVNLPGKKLVEVFYVDYGNQEVLMWDEIRKLQPQFLRIPPQALHCSMSDIAPVNECWTPEVNDFIKQFLYTETKEQKFLRVFVDNVVHNVLKVVLYDSSDEDLEICINALLCREGYAKSVGFSSTFVEFPRAGGIPIPAPGAPIKFQTLNIPKTHRKKKPVSKPDSMTEENSSVSVQGEKTDQDAWRLEVKVLNCVSPDCIYVSLVSREALTNKLMDELQQFYANATSHVVGKWEVNSKCCAFSVKHKLWYRATILELLPDDQAKVFLSDLAQTETVPITNLQILAPRFLEYRTGGIKCHLAGIHAAGDKKEWPILACEYLNELIEKYPTVYIAKQGEIEDTSLPVELWVKHVTGGGPLDPTVEEWITLNSKLSDQGLAIPNRSEGELERVPSLQVLKELDAQSEEQSRNIVSEWLNKSAQAEGSCSNAESVDATVEVDTDVTESVSDMDEAGAAAPKKKSKSKSVINHNLTDWLPSLPITKKKFRGVCTYVDYDCNIYFYDANESRDLMEFITEMLEKRYRNSKPKPHDQYWFSNQLCIAQYHHDKKWYRGKVLEVDSDDINLKVQFVDYGNIEDCKAQDLRKNICLTEIPIQSHKCRLADIKPNTPDGKWTVPVLDYIHQTLVDHTSHFTVVQQHRLGEPYLVRMRLDTEGRPDMAAHLVNDLHYAVYSYDTADDELELVPPSQSSTADEDASVIVEGEQVEEEEDDDVEEEEIEIEIEEIEEEEEIEIKKENDGSETDGTVPNSVSSLSDPQLQWSDLIELEEKKAKGVAKETKTEVNYKMLDLPECDSLPVQVTVFLNPTEVILNPWPASTSVLADVTKQFDQLSAELQKHAESQPPIRNPIIGQPCCACYSEDNLWYRTVVSAIEEGGAKVKIEYVDYGNMEILPVDKVHTLKPEWTEVPVMGIRCRLWGIKVADNWNRAVFYPKMKACVANPPLMAKIKTVDPILEAELVNEDGVLAYQSLLDEGLLVQTE